MVKDQYRYWLGQNPVLQNNPAVALPATVKKLFEFEDGLHMFWAVAPGATETVSRQPEEVMQRLEDRAAVSAERDRFDHGSFMVYSEIGETRMAKNGVVILPRRLVSEDGPDKEAREVINRTRFNPGDTAHFVAKKRDIDRNVCHVIRDENCRYNLYQEGFCDEFDVDADAQETVFPEAVVDSDEALCITTMEVVSIGELL